MTLFTKILIAFSVLLIIVFALVKKGKIPVKYALVWIFSALVMIVAACFPNGIQNISEFFGFELSSNFILTLFLGLVILITICLTIIMSEQSKKINMLIQEISILKEKLDKK